MPAREVTLAEREAAERDAAVALEEWAREYVEAVAAGDRDRALKASRIVDAALQDCRRTTRAREKTEKRLARRAELTTNEEDGRGA